MWTFFKNLFSDTGTPPPPAAINPDPEHAFQSSSDGVVLLDHKLIQQKFLEIVKYYNDVVMTNTIVFSEEEILNYQKKIFKLENERNKFMKNEPATTMDVDGDFFKYILKKNEHIQATLGSYNKQLSFFYIEYKKRYDWFSITIIILSSSLSLVEGITLCFSDANAISTIISLITSTTIAVLTSILKFKNYNQTLEDVVKTKEKIHGCQAKIFTFDKELKTTIFLCNNTNEHIDDIHRGATV